MEYLIGVGVALVVCAFAMVAGFDRDRVFYPTVLAVTSTYSFCSPSWGTPRRPWPSSPRWRSRFSYWR